MVLEQVQHDLFECSCYCMYLHNSVVQVRKILFAKGVIF